MNTFRAFSDQPSSAVDVLLVTMPFGLLNKPSIGLSLLRAGLQQMSVSSTILYFTLLFAKRIGIDIYKQLATGPFAFTGQAGEWVFSSALFPGQDPAPYLETALFADDLHCGNDTATRTLELEALSKHLLAVRNQVNSFIDECLEIVSHYHPKIVGFTSTFQQQLASLALAKGIKAQFPDTTLLFGGANVEGIMGVELLRQFPFVDAVVSGEGDAIFPEIVTRLLAGKNLRDIPGVSTRHTLDVICHDGGLPNAPSVQNMDQLPYPDYDDFFEQKHELNLEFPVYLLYETSRGCWWGAKHHCTFCGLNGLTMQFRSKSPGRALQELVYLAERYSGHHIAAVDNILDITYFKTFLPALAALNLGLELFYEVKANLKKEQLRLLRQANICMIQPGIESFSTPVLHLMHKGIRALQNIQLLKWCEEFGIVPFWNLLWGFPNEPPEEYTRMARLLPLLSHLTPPRGAGQVRLDRFSPLFVEAERHGLTNVRPYPSYRYIYPDLSDESLTNLAYYFTFEYQDSRDIYGYTRSITQATCAWKEDYERSFLFLMHLGEEVVIWDLRPIATTKLIRLTGLEHDLYLACDTIQGLDVLLKRVQPYGGSISRNQLQELLQHFVDMQLMLVEEDTYLSLAVWLTEDSPQWLAYQQAFAVLEQLQQLPEYHRMAISQFR